MEVLVTSVPITKYFDMNHCRFDTDNLRLLGIRPLGFLLDIINNGSMSLDEIITKIFEISLYLPLFLKYRLTYIDFISQLAWK